VFLFYDNSTVFDLPYYSIKAASISDYDKIVFQPYNEQFWQHNEVLLPSKKVLEYRDFFNEHGVLLNYENLSEYYSIAFRQSIVTWSEQRLFYTDINKNEMFYEDPSSRFYYHRSKTTPFFYALNLEIYLDRNTFNDSTIYLSKTLIKLDESFYFSYIGKNTTGFINIYFDLAEIERRKMMDVLKQKEWSKQQVDSIYKSTLVKLRQKLEFYIKNAFYGLNEKHFLSYVKQVKEALSIDNSMLIIDDDFLIEDEDNIFIDLYNYGNVLYVDGKYEQSLEILLKAYNMGDKHPWLYYNLALNYLVLNDIDNACYFFMKSREVGQQLDPYILKRCSEKLYKNPE
jgi:tetratricopeptide (TPR) repeat protein